MEGHLERVRGREIAVVQPWFKPGTRVLELGGGSGFQASLLAARGCEVVSIDIADRPSAHDLFFPVQTYDGRHIPAADASVDVVFSSSVLEHIRPLPPILDETRRVLRPEGLAVHIVPSATWRFWTTLSYYPYVVKRLLGRRGTVPETTPPAAAAATGRRQRLAKVAKYASPLAPHGAYPNGLAELYYFRRDRWRRLFEENGFGVRSASGDGIFYTGSELFPRLPFWVRQRLARALGSTCHIFVLQVKPEAKPPAERS